MLDPTPATTAIPPDIAISAIYQTTSRCVVYGSSQRGQPRRLHQRSVRPSSGACPCLCGWTGGVAEEEISLICLRWSGETFARWLWVNLSASSPLATPSSPWAMFVVLHFSAEESAVSWLAWAGVWSFSVPGVEGQPRRHHPSFSSCLP